MWPSTLDRDSPAIAALLASSPAPPLDAGTPDAAAASRLRDLDALFAPAQVRNTTMARACLAGLWLWFNHLDESHHISQELHTPEGSFWHGIMHRREGDYGNAKYWFRRVGDHLTFTRLAATAAQLAAGVEGAPALGSHKNWDPYAFVDLCEQCVDGQSHLTPLCQELQRVEWHLLFEHCYTAATSR
jgi:hypothetical protein